MRGDAGGRNIPYFCTSKASKLSSKLMQALAASWGAREKGGGGEGGGSRSYLRAERAAGSLSRNPTAKGMCATWQWERVR